VLLSLFAALAAATPTPADSVGLRVAELTNVSASGVQAGWLIGGGVVSGPRRRSLGYVDYVEYQQDFLARSNPVAPLLMPVTTAANIAPLVMLRKEAGSPRFWLTAAGLACNVGVMAAAVAYNIPMIERIEGFTPTEQPADWRDVRRKWETGQRTRMIFSVAAFGANAAAAVAF
jgi:hypothetical protein